MSEQQTYTILQDMSNGSEQRAEGNNSYFLEHFTSFNSSVPSLDEYKTLDPEITDEILTMNIRRHNIYRFLLPAPSLRKKIQSTRYTDVK
jgi:hypothetical protein